MRPLLVAERACTIGHILAMLFGLAGLVLVLPHPEFIANLPAIGQSAFALSMAGGGVVYMILGATAVALYARRVYGQGAWLAFMLPAVFISLGSELLGTGTGFPFGEYHYLSGLGYKISGRVPFTIPLSWFYVGFVTYAISRAALDRRTQLPNWARVGGSIALGSLLLTFWDFVLDPAMSQTAMQFWMWDQPGNFFGMPLQNFIGWFGTGVLFMSVASLFWSKLPLPIARPQLNVALTIYMANIVFGAVLSLAAGMWAPVALTVLFAIVPVLMLYAAVPVEPTLSDVELLDSEMAAPSVASVGVDA